MSGQPQDSVPRVRIEEELVEQPTSTWHDEEVKADYESIDSNVLFAKEVGVSVDYSRQIALVNKIIHEDIGFGAFQIKLTLLAGFGWLADNIWFEVLSMTLTLVKEEWNLGEREHSPKWATFSLYSGLLIGSLAWGFLSDVIGRRPSWNLTLFISAAFGIAVGAAPSFPVMCVLLGLLGLGLGGNLPVDGAMLIEYIPGPQQWILTFLSLFWCIGQLYAALISWAFITNYYCEDNINWKGSDNDKPPCLKADNWGWRYSWFLLGGTVMLMFIIRFLVYPVPESPKFLLAAGREEEAYEVLLFIAKENKKKLHLTFEQLRDAKFKPIAYDATNTVHAVVESDSPKENPKSQVQYGSTYTRWMQRSWNVSGLRPDNIRRTLKHIDRSPLSALFASRKMARNTIFITLCWGLIGLAYPLYNSFIATYLAQINDASDDAESLSRQYRDLVIMSVCGIPGSFVAAAGVEIPRIGRRGTMAFFTMLTGLFLFLFTTANNSSAILGWNCAVNLTQNAMYAVLYAITYEVFPAPQRGTGDGLSMSVQRVFGIVATIVAVYASQNGFKPPIYVSASAFIVTSALMLLLPYEPRGTTAI